MPFEEQTDLYTVIRSDPDGSIIKMIDAVTEPVLQNRDSSVVNTMFGLKDGALQLNDNVLSHPITKKLLADPKTKFDMFIICPFLGMYLVL